MAAAEQAIFLDPTDAWAYAAGGAAFRLDGDLTRARSEFETALRIAPTAVEILILHASWVATTEAAMEK